MDRSPGTVELDATQLTLSLSGVTLASVHRRPHSQRELNDEGSVAVNCESQSMLLNLSRA